MLTPYLRKVDTVSLSNRINLKLNIADTSSMLSPYLRKVDTVSLSNRINLKLNIADTATMLTPYLRKADTTAMLTPYLRKVDTVSLSNRINLKLNIADTSSMLSPYLRKVDTVSLSNRINTKISYADTLTSIQNKLTLTTTGTTGAATLSGRTLNIPNYGVSAATVRDSQRHYFTIPVFRQKDTVTNNYDNADYIVVPADLQSWCIRTMSAKGFTGAGTVSLELYVDNSLQVTLSSIGNGHAFLTPQNISISSGSLIHVKTVSLSGTLIGLTATIQVQRTCN
jgi:hypothetical protein